MAAYAALLRSVDQASRPFLVWRRPLLLLVGALFLASSIQLQTGWGGRGADVVFGNVAYNALPLVAAACCVLRRSSAKHERRAWQMLGLGLASWGLGNVYYDIAFFNVPEAEVPFPSLADVGYLGFYPPVFVGLALLVRAQLVCFTREFWIDGLIAGLTVGGVGAALVFDRVLESSGGDSTAIATNLAYPLADLILLALVVGGLALGGWRVSWTWLLISLGLGLFAIADAVYLLRVANGTYEYGSLLDVGWLVAIVLLVWASAVPTAARPASTDRRALPLIPAGFAAVDVALVVYDHFVGVELLAVLLVAGSLLAVVARMSLTLIENGTMLRASQREAATDPLTGLRNRRQLQLDLATLIERPAERHVLLMLDLDGFKGYNDSFGHQAGDALLMRLARRLSEAAAGTGVAYRLGGDEFCLLAAAGVAEAGELRRRATAALSEDGEGFSIRSSCGLVAIPEEVTTASEALRIADLRMYEEKNTRPTAGRRAMDILLSALKGLDPELADHTGHVMGLALQVARRLELDAGTVEAVRSAAQLHDIGKIAIPDSILAKSGSLTASELEFMQRHTIIGERIVAAAPGLAPVAALIRSSHERWDGKGYPDGLAGEQIPLAARIVFACDSYDTMLSGRPYQAQKSPQEARSELERKAGTQFDPNVVEALLQVLGASAELPNVKLQSRPRRRSSAGRALHS